MTDHPAGYAFRLLELQGQVRSRVLMVPSGTGARVAATLQGQRIFSLDRPLGPGPVRLVGTAATPFGTLRLFEEAPAKLPGEAAP